MRNTFRRIGFALAATFLVLSAGCGASTGFVYKPNLTPEAGRKVPLKVAVLPFADATAGSTARKVHAMGPELWAKSFADEMAASDRFESARFIYSPAELKDEEFLVDGTVKKAFFLGRWDHLHEILISFRAARASDRKVVWEKEFGQAWKTPTSVGGWCVGAPCVIAAFHGDWNRGVAALFAEARADLAAALSSLPKGAAAGRGAGADTPVRPAGESLEQTIDRILKGK